GARSGLREQLRGVDGAIGSKARREDGRDDLDVLFEERAVRFRPRLVEARHSKTNRIIFRRDLAVHRLAHLGVQIHGPRVVDQRGRVEGPRLRLRGLLFPSRLCVQLALELEETHVDPGIAKSSMVSTWTSVGWNARASPGRRVTFAGARKSRR